ncbi:MAG: universal stress protein [Candidatus Aminicenantaceae bacterium]
MLPINKILWPTDFSEPSYNALKSAVEMAEKFGSTLYLVHVIAPIPAVAGPMGPAGFDVSLYQEELKKSASKKLKQISENKVPEKIKIQTIIKHGEAATEINRAAKEENIDLIVIATHGETGLGHLIFGSVAEKVVRNASSPVLTIRVSEEKD